VSEHGAGHAEEHAEHAEHHHHGGHGEGHAEGEQVAAGSGDHASNVEPSPET